MIRDAADDLALNDPADWTPTARIQRAVALGIARVLIGDELHPATLTTPAPSDFDGFLWHLAAVGDEGESLSADAFERGCAGIEIDGAPVRAALTVTALERVDPSWYRWRHADGYLMLVLGDPDGTLRFVQPLPGYHHETNRGFPALPVTAPAVATLDELVPLIRDHMARLDRMIGWTLTDLQGDGMYRCAPSYINDHADLVSDVVANPGHAAAGIPPSINGLVLDGFVPEPGSDIGAAFVNPDTGGRLRLYREPGTHGSGCWCVGAMNRAAFDALDAADEIEQAVPRRIIASTPGPVLRPDDASGARA